MPRSAPTHKPMQSKAHGQDRQARRALNTGSVAWRRLRASVLIRDHYVCAACGRFGDHVDHIDNDSHNNDERNLQTLCIKCHGVKTATEQAGGKLNPKPVIDETGAPQGW